MDWPSDKDFSEHVVFFDYLGLFMIILPNLSWHLLNILLITLAFYQTKVWVTTQESGKPPQPIFNQSTNWLIWLVLFQVILIAHLVRSLWEVFSRKLYIRVCHVCFKYWLHSSSPWLSAVWWPLWVKRCHGSVDRTCLLASMQCRPCSPPSSSCWGYRLFIRMCWGLRIYWNGFNLKVLNWTSQWLFYSPTCLEFAPTPSCTCGLLLPYSAAGFSTGCILGKIKVIDIRTSSIMNGKHFSLYNWAYQLFELNPLNCWSFSILDLLWLVLHFLSFAVPISQTIYIGDSFVTTLIPISARSGINSNPEIAISLLTTALALLFISFMVSWNSYR